jgi:hypothetical protein
MEDIQIMVILKGPVVNDIWNIQDCHITSSIKKLKMYFEDLFDGNKELSEYTNSNIFHSNFKN